MLFNYENHYLASLLESLQNVYYCCELLKSIGWIQHISKKNLTLGLTRPLLQSVVTLPVDFSATRSVFLLRSCNIPQCSQRRGQEKIGRFLSYGDGSNQSLYYQTDSSTRRTAVNAKISPQQKKRSFFSPKS